MNKIIVIGHFGEGGLELRSPPGHGTEQEGTLYVYISKKINN